jgi:hypothetical protein
MYSVENQPAFRKNMSPSLLEQAELPTSFTMASFVAYSSILKKETAHSSETSVVFQRNTWRCIPEYETL